MNGLPPVETGFTETAAPPSVELCQRIIRAWRVTTRKAPDGLWSLISERYHGPFVALLDSHNVCGLQEYLADIYRRDIWHGIDQTGEETATIQTGPEVAVTHIADRLAAFAEALGVLPVENPEQGHWAENLYRDPEQIVTAIEQEIGIPLIPPVVADGRFGLKLRGGILCLKDIYAAYAAWRIRGIVGEGSVLEIGGGNGMTAYYARLFGVREYAIVDLPQISAAQMFVLESLCPGQVSLLPCTNGFPSGKFDLIFNQDAMPEMGTDAAGCYLDAIAQSGAPFLSINHEAETDIPGGSHPIIGRLARERGMRRVSRAPYWLRKGYVEEIFQPH